MGALTNNYVVAIKCLLAFCAGSDISRMKKVDIVNFADLMMKAYKGQVELYMKNQKPECEKNCYDLKSKLYIKFNKNNSSLNGDDIINMCHSAKRGINSDINPILKDILVGKGLEVPSGRVLEDVKAELLKTLWAKLHESPAAIKKRIGNKVREMQKSNPRFSEADVEDTLRFPKPYDAEWRPQEWRVFEECGYLSSNPYDELAEGLVKKADETVASRDKTMASDGPVDAYGRKKVRKLASGIDDVTIHHAEGSQSLSIAVSTLEVMNKKHTLATLIELALTVGKEGFPSVVFEVVCSHSRRILSCSKAFPGSFGDATIAKYDDFLTSIDRGTYDDYSFRLYDEEGNSFMERGLYLIADGGYFD